MNREVITQHLQRALLFRDTTAAERDSFSTVARVQTIAEGSYVYRQGDASEVFFVIATGEAELVLERSDGMARVVGRIGPGGHFGETGILTGKSRSLSVRALSELVVICFDKRYFRTAFLANSRIHQLLDAALAERLRVAFVDHADTVGEEIPSDEASADDVILFKDKFASAIQLRRLAKQKDDEIRASKTAKKTQAIIDRFSASSLPFMLTGEAGTGKSIIARQIHMESSRATGQYREVDLREFEPGRLEQRLLGTEQNGFPFVQAEQAGFFEKTSGGTIVFTHVHLMPQELQEKLLSIIAAGSYRHIDSDRPLAMQSRIAFISNFSLDHLHSSGKFLPELLAYFSECFDVPPLRNHKEDLPRLVSYYLGRHSREYGKNIHSMSSETLGIFLNYDWPGNLTELSSVIRRAVMLAQKDEIVPEQILLGLPKTEGKWEYNILRLDWIRKFLASRIFPRVPQVVIGCVFIITVLFLFFGPDNPESNLGLTLGWYIGWPLLFFSFFFLARTWCSVCSFAVPGTLLQNVVKPTRKTPEFIKKYSGWIMAILCILVFWVEIIWDAYNNPYLTGGIILIITLGSILFSVLFSRRSWCRYLCPLGAVNAIFAMPAVVEMRSNRHVCLNRCQNHACFTGDADESGCPMFRHPYLVDNNKDCIMCAKCIKNCDNSSIQLNLRLAPQELWALETPRRADSFLIVAMGAIFFPFTLQKEFAQLVGLLGSAIGRTGPLIPEPFLGSVLFFLWIALFQAGYYGMVRLQCLYAKMDKNLLLPLFGYACIPLILGGYLAFHLNAFVRGAGRIVPNLQETLGLNYSYDAIRLISADSTFVLQIITVIGGLLASLYATFRVLERAMPGDTITSRTQVIPFSFLIILAGLFLYIV